MLTLLWQLLARQSCQSHDYTGRQRQVCEFVSEHPGQPGSRPCVLRLGFWGTRSAMLELLDGAVTCAWDRGFWNRAEDREDSRRWQQEGLNPQWTEHGGTCWAWQHLGRSVLAAEDVGWQGPPWAPGRAEGTVLLPRDIEGPPCTSHHLLQQRPLGVGAALQKGLQPVHHSWPRGDTWEGGTAWGTTWTPAPSTLQHNILQGDKGAAVYLSLRGETPDDWSVFLLKMGKSSFAPRTR